MLRLTENSSKLVITWQIIMADATKNDFIFSTATLKGNPPFSLKANSSKSIFQVILSYIMILILNPSAENP